MSTVELPQVVRDTLFDAHFEQQMDMRGALAFVRLVCSVRIDPEDAARLIREESLRRTLIEEAAQGEKLTDALQRKQVQRRARQPLLEARGKHAPKLDYVKGKVLATCSCGATVGRFERGDTHEIELSWYRHRDGTAVWKKA